MISEYFKGGGVQYHEIQIVKNFGFWAPHLSNSTTPTSFAKVSKASKCHLLGLFCDSKNSKRLNQSPCPERKEKCSMYLVIDWVSSSHGCRLWLSSQGNTQEMVTGEIPKKTKLGTTVPPQAAGHPSSNMIFSYKLLEASGRAAVARNHTHLPDLACSGEIVCLQNTCMQIIPGCCWLKIQLWR